MKIAENVYTSQAIQHVEEFVSSLEQIWRNLAVCYFLTNGSSVLNGCLQK